MPEIVISNFSSVRPPSLFGLGDGSWNTDHDLSGSDLKVGVNGTATTHGGCSASFSDLDLSSVMFAGSGGALLLYAYRGELESRTKLTLTDSDGGAIAWMINSGMIPGYETESLPFVLRQTALAGRPNFYDGSVVPSLGKLDRLKGGFPVGTPTINWTKVNGFKLEVFGGPFAPRPFEMGFTDLIACRR